MQMEARGLRKLGTTSGKTGRGSSFLDDIGRESKSHVDRGISRG